MRESRRSVALALAAALGAPGCNGNGPASPTLAATCAPSPSAGVAPLSVTFALNVTGGAAGAFDVAINYGDGATSNALNLVHVYSSAGSYAATFTVRSGGQTSLCSASVSVTSGPGSGPSPSPTPTTGENQPPLAVFKTTPTAGTGDQLSGRAPFSVNFNMCASSDVDRDVLLWTMDFDGDGKTEVRGSTGGDCRRANVYAVGSYHPKICVTDVGPDEKPLHPFQCRDYMVQVTP